MNEFKYSGEELHVFERAVNWKAYWVEKISPYMGKRILEIGAGIGSTTVALKDFSFDYWVSVEPDALLCEKMANKQRLGIISNAVEIFNGTASDLVYKNKFDTIIYIDVLEHIESDAAELRDVAKLLEEGGNIIILSPAHNFLFSPFDAKIGHYRRYNKKLLKSILPPGLSIQKIQYLDSVGFIASLANKMILKQSDPLDSQIAFWDKAMVPISRILDRFIFYSAGKSILAVFQK